MSNARIFFGENQYSAVSDSPYARELVFEMAEALARIHGSATLHIASYQCLVSVPPKASHCHICEIPPRPASYSSDGEIFCRRCLQTMLAIELSAVEAAAPRKAPQRKTAAPRQGLRAA